MDTVVGDRFKMFTSGITRMFVIRHVVVVPLLAGKKRRKPKYEYKVENVSIDCHPAMGEKTKEKLRYFTISDEVLRLYVEKGRWIKL